jgi:hypothetical protein
MAGVAAVSADGRTLQTNTDYAVSSYKPENGPAASGFAGYHFNNWFSLQGLYFWQRNDLTFDALRPSGRYEQTRGSSQHAAFADFLIYFRPRTSRLRPWLATGGGFVRLASDLRSNILQQGDLPLPPDRFSGTKPAIRSSVGIDVSLRNGWALRYSFGETISRNPLSKQLSPPGERNMASFQNLVGLMKSF